MRTPELSLTSSVHEITVNGMQIYTVLNIEATVIWAFCLHKFCDVRLLKAKTLFTEASKGFFYLVVFLFQYLMPFSWFTARFHVVLVAERTERKQTNWIHFF